MKIFTDKRIKALFSEILICILAFVIVTGLIIGMDVNNGEIFIFLCEVCGFVIILDLIYRYFRTQNKIIEAAQVQIAEYISGNTEARIECDEEGELYKLFHKVNALAAILNAHAENELKSREFLKNVISDISHQLKTPLAALNIYNGIMQDENTNALEIKEFADLTEQEIDRIETLVQNLLKITKLDAGTIVFVKNSENVSDMMENVKKHFMYRAGKEDKEIILTGDTNINLLCDKDWIIQITIKDNGYGIHPEDLHYIFKRFYRSRFSKDTQGVGLGLPLAKSIVEAHNGTIEVDSELDRGTTFIINFVIPTKL